VWCMLQGSSSSRFNARIVHGYRQGVHVGLGSWRLGDRGLGLVGLWARGVRYASRLIEFEVEGSCVSWLEARGSCGARGSKARRWGLGFALGLGL
jgi:hypothetical protein